MSWTVCALSNHRYFLPIKKKVKELLIESLTFLESDALLIAIDRLQKDTKIHFVTKLEDCEYFVLFWNLIWYAYQWLYKQRGLSPI